MGSRSKWPARHREEAARRGEVGYRGMVRVERHRSEPYVRRLASWIPGSEPRIPRSIHDQTFAGSRLDAGNDLVRWTLTWLDPGPPSATRYPRNPSAHRQPLGFQSHESGYDRRTANHSVTTMQLEIRQGAHLYTADEEDLGKIRQFVVKPSTAELTHVLVEKGVFFPDERVVPLEAIDHADGDEVVLADDADPADLPRFVREDYTPIDEETQNHLDVPAGYIWRYPTSYTGPYPMYPAFPMPPPASGRPTVSDDRTRDQLAKGELIRNRTPVVSTNGEKIGTVSEMHVDDEGDLSHLVVDLGFLSDEKLLPAHWIEKLDSEGVKLAVGNHAVESLETIT